jgi:spore germination cell wall hydrolase CwlJ-like protein
MVSLIKYHIVAFLLLVATLPTSLATMPPSIDWPSDEVISEYKCMVTALYFEARGESIIGVQAVANVILNRTTHYRFPGSVCEVVKQRNKRTCQFSWYCDKKPRILPDTIDIKIKEIAYSAVITKSLKDVTGGALFFHSKTVQGWERLNRTRQIGNHYFYKY